jgi:UDP-N-acetylmuramate dehydrogenase
MLTMTTDLIPELRHRFGASLYEDEPLARYTSARVGGKADVLVIAENATVLESIVRFLWLQNAPYFVLGGGSNVLVSDLGFPGIVVLNRARQVKFDLESDFPSVWAESGTNFGSLARQACQRGLSGLEWAVGVPGTIGGAVVGNAGAHDGDIAGNLVVAEILHHMDVLQPVLEEQILKEVWTQEKLAFRYRYSALKELAGRSLVLAAQLRLTASKPESTLEKADRLSAYRRRTQPPGATMGSMFKNPPGDYAGRLIEAAGLKGVRVGDSQISELHANFFLNLGKATANDIYALICMARQEVEEKFSVRLELEIELVGDWQLDSTAS